MAEELRLGETFQIIAHAVYRQRIFALGGNDLAFFPGEQPAQWRIGRLHRPELSRPATEREVGHYMSLLAPQLPVAESRRLIWLDVWAEWGAQGPPDFRQLLRRDGEPVTGIPSLVGHLLPAARRPAG